MDEQQYECPVCGYPELGEPPWTGNRASFEICPSCGTEFGYDDAAGGDEARRPSVYNVLREAWIAEGMPWWAERARVGPKGRLPK